MHTDEKPIKQLKTNTMKTTLLITSGITAMIGGILAAGGNNIGGILLAISIFCYAFGTSIKKEIKPRIAKNEYTPNNK